MRTSRLGTSTSAVIPGTKRSPGLGIRSLMRMVLMSRLSRLTSRWVAKSPSAVLTITLPVHPTPLGMRTFSWSPMATASAWVSGMGA